MHAGTAQTDKDPELGRRPLRGGRPAVAAAVVGVGFLDLEELDLSVAVQRGLGVNLEGEGKSSGERRRAVPLI
jgi:hypothetical protein